jgi:probable rRNA maturation factor
MADLHLRFMDIPGPTDVLTFELDHDPRGRVTAGEVVVCVPYALREARRRRVPPRAELLLYALHGMLHLCGYDDRTDRDFATMHRREDEILNQLGVGPVFARPPATAPPRRPRRSGARA